MSQLVYRARETAITWRSTGGSLAITLTTLGAAAGRQGAVQDFGASADVSRLYVWRAFLRFNTAPVLGEVVEIYGKTGDGTNRDNDDGTGDIVVSAVDKLNNLTRIGSLVVDEAATGVTMSASGLIALSSREFMPVFWNGTADALSSTAADNGFDLVPVPDNIQDVV